ncbi:MAG: 2-C-methyl-D-erythritol 4-phosphate cytidylyltransferase [Lachnospiraceae bacterium]|nr:2-C-methyl-D-erythritol 4-phosphate cytidylyltransferase [Lachnospiraceae bacterium]
MNLAVIFAGGTGQRMKTTNRPKQFLEMHGKPIIIYTLEIFEKHPDIDGIVVACVEEWIPYLKELLDRFHIEKVKKVVPGGVTGQMSIYNGLTAAKEIAGEEKSIILIHDGVRPLINEGVITDNINSVKQNGSAITSAIVKETIMVVKDDNSIDYVPDRAHSRVAKAPQSFWLDEILEVHHKAQQDGITDFIDSCTMMKYYGHKLFLIDGPYENIKITTPDDFYTMRALLDAQENAQIYVD